MNSFQGNRDDFRGRPPRPRPRPGGSSGYSGGGGSGYGGGSAYGGGGGGGSSYGGGGYGGGYSSRPSRPSRGSHGRPPPRPKAPPKPAGPAVFQPLVPASRGEWKRMYTGTIKRLSRQLGRHAHDLIDMSEEALLAAADTMPAAPSRSRGIALQLIRKLARLRGQKPQSAKK